MQKGHNTKNNIHFFLPCSDLSSPSPTSFHSASAAVRVDGSDVVQACSR